MIFNQKTTIKDSDLQNWLVVGLGNPGAEYGKTRHNLGFMVVDKLAEDFHVQVRRDECRALIGQTVFENETVELVKPQTYMNLSGESLSCLLKKNNRSINKLVVIMDDLALPFGSIRLRKKGSSGGHNGLKSVKNCLKTENYIRLRIGIKPNHPLSNTKKFVLDEFSKNDFEKLEEIIKKSADAILNIISEGIEKAMSKYNG